jgi:hypothetical protein
MTTQSAEGFGDLKGEEISCAIIIGSTVGIWLSMLIIVCICKAVGYKM